MQLTRLSQFSAFELGQVYGADLNDIDLFVYDFNNSTGKQVLGSDTGNNSRNYSTTPYLQNILLKTTPEPYFPNTYHNAHEIKQLVTSVNLPIIQFQKVRLQMAAGWSYPANISGLWFRVYVKINDVEVTLASIIDEYFSSRFVPNSYEYVLENQVFTQNIEVDIIDVNFLFSQTDPAMKEIIDVFTGGLPVSTVSPLMVDFGFIENGAIITFTEGGYPFQRFTTLTDFRTQVVQPTSAADNELMALLNIEHGNTPYIQCALAHTTMSLVAYFNQFQNSNEETDVFHQLTLSYYDSTDTLLATQAIELRNFAEQFEPVTFIPTEYYTSDHIYLRLVSKAVNSGSGQTWIRTNELVVLTAVLKAQPFNFTFNELKVTNQITKIEHKVEHSGDLPSVIQILKPVYYILTDKVQPTLSLSPFDASFGFTIDPAVIISKKLTMRIGERTYDEDNRTSTTVTFTVKALEYYKADTEYYIVDQNSQEVFRGKITRYGVQS